MGTELLVILLGAFVVALAWFLLKFGKTLARVALVASGLALAIILALALLQTATTAKRAVTVATVASTGAAGVSGVALLLSGLLVASVGVIGYLIVKMKLVERGTLLLKRKRRRELLAEPQQVVYRIEDEGAFDLTDIDLSKWGF